MHRLWLSTSLLLLICFTSATMPLNSLAPDAGATDKTSNCTSVPFPFGVPGVALEPDFEVTCTGTTTEERTEYLPNGTLTQRLSPSLKLPSGTYLIQNISLQGQVRIFTGPIYQRCNGTEKLSRGNGWLNLTGTPFTLSKNYTTFVAIGCDDIVMLETFDRDGNNGEGGCVAFCSNTNSATDGPCSGLGCCQIPLPGPGGLKSFNLSLQKIKNMEISQIPNCSVAFFTTPDEFSFKTAHLYNKDYFYDLVDSHVAVLDWAITNKTCAIAMKHESSFACKNNSQCYDSPSGLGYFCDCSQGYKGNPYVLNGCTDVNECQYPETNTCIGRCINTEGSYKCACPPGKTGDGKKEGIGCKKEFPLVSVLGLTIVLGLGTGCIFFLSYFSIRKRIKMFEKRKLQKLKEKFFNQNRGFLLQQCIASDEDATQRIRIFTLDELEKATNRFDKALIIGQGGHGEVYKGILSDQRIVAIKRSKIVDQAEIDQFINEVVILSQVNHRNVVKVYGCCLETEVPLLVYEFISNGTLFYHLHAEPCSLTWTHRLRIALEAARAIAYLHSSASISVFHRDIKSSNILLDDYFTSKVSDFGASRSVQLDQTGITTGIQGTFGYLDPEYYYTGRLTPKSDVYSFGVILVELLTREKPYLMLFEGGGLVSYFTSAMKGNRLFEILDPQVAVNEGPRTEIEAVANLAEICVGMKGEERPTMKEVEVRLEVLWQSNQHRKHPCSYHNLEKIPLLFHESTAGNYTSTTRQYSFEQELLSSSNFPR